MGRIILFDHSQSFQLLKIHPSVFIHILWLKEILLGLRSSYSSHKIAYRQMKSMSEERARI